MRHRSNVVQANGTPNGTRGMTHQRGWPAVQGEHRPWQVQWILRRTGQRRRYGAEDAAA